jgi:hypothetical protein
VVFDSFSKKPDVERTAREEIGEAATKKENLLQYYLQKILILCEKLQTTTTTHILPSFITRSIKRSQGKRRNVSEVCEKGSLIVTERERETKDQNNKGRRSTKFLSYKEILALFDDINTSSQLVFISD